MSEKDPSEEALRQQLQLEWEDHIQTRAQTWKTLGIEIALAAGLIGIDIKLNVLWATLILGLLVIVLSISGITTTIHHRNNQILKFTHIHGIEAALGLHKPGLLDDVRLPAPFKLADVFNLKKINTPLYILRAHIVILIFVLVYLGVRIYIPA